MAKYDVGLTVGVEQGPLSDSLNQATAGVRASAGQMQGMLTSLGNTLRTALPVIALTELASVMTRVARQSIEMGDNLNKAAIKAGLTGESMSSLSYAAKMVDIDLSSLSTALRFMQVNLSQAGSGAKAPLETLTALGLTFKDLAKLAPDKQFELLAQRISQLKDPADRARAATELFGRSGSALLPLFEDGAKGIRAAREEAERLGLVMKNDQIKALAGADDSIKRLSASWDHFAAVLTSKVAPAISAVMDQLSGNAAAGRIAARGTDDLKAFQRRLLESQQQGTLTGGEEKTLALVQQELARRAPRPGPRAGTQVVTPGYEPPPDKPGKTFKSPEESTDNWIARQAGNGMASAADDMRAIAEDQARSDRALSVQLFEQKRALQMQEVDQKAEALQQMASLGQISALAEIEGLRKLDQERFAIEQAALLRRAGDIEAEPIDRQRALDDLELMERQHYERLRQMDTEARAARLAPLNELFGNMRAGLHGVLSNFLNFQAGVGTTMRALAASIAGAFMDMAAKIAAQWLMMKLTQLLFSKTTIAGKAAEAGAGGVASMAAAPFPLNMGAPVFGATMAALAASYLAIPAAAQGWDLPTGINPIAQLHSGEMVLPQKHADVIRALAEGGGQSSGGGQSPVHIHGMDTQSIARALSRNGGGPVGQALKAFLRSRGFKDRE